jgi:hypothetical protein
MTKLWEQVEGKSEQVPEIEDHWKMVEAKRSEVPDKPDDDAVEPSVTDGATTAVLHTDLETLKEVIPAPPIVHLESVSDEPENKSNDTSAAQSVQQPTQIERLESVPVENPNESQNGYSDHDVPNAASSDVPLFDRRRPSGDDEEFSMEFLSNRSVPLPSFGDADFQNGSQVDLDDISRVDEDSDSASMSAQVSYGASFATNPLFTDRNTISAYDNFGDKKVGRDNEGPVFMFVPKSGERLRVGDRLVHRQHSKHQRYKWSRS